MDGGIELDHNPERQSKKERIWIRALSLSRKARNYRLNERNPKQNL
jgi:hypothetical protein